MDYIIATMPLNKEKIISHLSSHAQNDVGEINCFNQLDSTNRWLMDQASKNPVNNQICIADAQTAGIGRNGKSWQASASKNILLSIAHQFTGPVAKLSGLSLVTALALVDALEQFGVDQLAVKWPNDVYLDGKKLAGILIQNQSITKDVQYTVVGVGLNISIEKEEMQNINQPVAELRKVGLGIDQREKIMAGLIENLLAAFDQFSVHGLEAFYSRWNELDYLKNKKVELKHTHETVKGRYVGINAEGAMRIALPNNQIEEYYVGELSVKAV